MKKLLTLLFAVALTLSLSSVAFGQDTGSADKKEAKKEAKAEKKTKKKAAKKKDEKKDDMKKDDSMKK